MLKYLENEEIEDYATNKHLIGMKELSRGCTVKAWKGVDFSKKKCREVNKIVVIKCLEYHVKCCKHRCECMHDENKQRERVIDWCKNVDSRIENSEMTQLKMHLRRCKIKFQQIARDRIKRSITNVR